MEKSTWQLVLSAIAAAGVLWNAVQIQWLDSKLDELAGKVDTIETFLEGHVNAPALHSRLPAPEAPDNARSAAR